MPITLPYSINASDGEDLNILEHFLESMVIAFLNFTSSILHSMNDLVAFWGRWPLREDLYVV